MQQQMQQQMHQQMHQQMQMMPVQGMPNMMANNNGMAQPQPMMAVPHQQYGMQHMQMQTMNAPVQTQAPNAQAVNHNTNNASRPQTVITAGVPTNGAMVNAQGQHFMAAPMWGTPGVASGTNAPANGSDSHA